MAKIEGKYWNWMREWGGRTYSYDSHFDRKKDAQKRAQSLRERGDRLARVTRQYKNWGVYIVWSTGQMVKRG